MTVGMTEEIEGVDGAGREGINRFDCFLSAFDPDELAVALVRLRLNPLRIGFSITIGTVDISGPIYDPDQAGIFSMLKTNLSHAKGRGSDKVPPPSIVLLIFMTKILPLPQCRTTAEDHVLPDVRSDAGKGKNNTQQNEESHGGKMG